MLNTLLYLACNPLTERTLTSTMNYSEPPLEASDHIEEAHASIMEKLDAIREVKLTLKKDYVPANVVLHLEQCIKDTEVNTTFHLQGVHLQVLRPAFPRHYTHSDVFSWLKDGAPLCYPFYTMVKHGAYKLFKY